MPSLLMKISSNSDRAARKARIARLVEMAHQGDFGACPDVNQESSDILRSGEPESPREAPTNGGSSPRLEPRPEEDTLSEVTLQE